MKIEIENGKSEVVTGVVGIVVGVAAAVAGKKIIAAGSKGYDRFNAWRESRKASKESVVPTTEESTAK